MVFGFNTDVKHEETVYHVQSEAQQAARLLLSTIFVKGQVFGKKTASYADEVSNEELTEQVIHELLKEQHRQVLDAIRDGKVEEIVTKTS